MELVCIPTSREWVVVLPQSFLSPVPPKFFSPVLTRRSYKATHRLRSFSARNIQVLQILAHNLQVLTNIQLDFQFLMKLSIDLFKICHHPICLNLCKIVNSNYVGIILIKKYYTPTQISNQQTRSKWNKTSENLKVSDLVWLLEDFTPRGLWPLAKVIEIYPGSNGVVHSVKLKTSHGEKLRPVIKLSKVLMNK